MRLKGVIKARHFFSLAFGTIVGVGWVVVLGQWLVQAGPLGAILGFVGGGIIMMLVGLCYAEMATMLPVAGGEVAYAYEVHGDKACFATGWFLSLAYISTTAFEAISVGWIAGALLPTIQGNILYMVRGDAVHIGSLLLGLGGMVLLTFLNYRGLKSAATFQDVLTYSLIALSAAFILMGIAGGETANLKPLLGKDSSRPMWAGVVAVLVTAPFWFAGFNVIPQVIEEKAARTSLRSIGRVILFSIGLAGIFYCLVILSSSMTMPWQNLVALDLPAAGAFEIAFGSVALGKLVLLAALFGLISTWNAVFIAASRVLFALGRARMILPALGSIHPVFHSPTTAILFVGIVASGAAFLGRSAILPVVSVAGTCFSFAFFLTCWGVIKMRRLRPRQERPYRVPGGRFTATVAMLGCVFMLLVSVYQPYVNAKNSFPIEWTFLLVWSALGILLWFLTREIRNRVSQSERRKLILGAMETLG